MSAKIRTMDHDIIFGTKVGQYKIWGIDQQQIYRILLLLLLASVVVFLAITVWQIPCADDAESTQHNTRRASNGIPGLEDHRQ